MSSDQFSVEYADVKEFPGYRISSIGEVWSCRPINGRGPLTHVYRKIKPTLHHSGRLVVSILNGKSKRQMQVHVLVLMAFVGPRPKGMQCRHFPDPDPKNCRLDNLLWGTQKENAEDSIKQGIQICGERCHKSKLTAQQVISIRKEHTGSRGENQRLARKYGIASTNISGIVKRKTWKHVK